MLELWRWLAIKSALPVCTVVSLADNLAQRTHRRLKIVSILDRVSRSGAGVTKDATSHDKTLDGNLFTLLRLNIMVDIVIITL